MLAVHNGGTGAKVGNFGEWAKNSFLKTLIEGKYP